MAVIAILAAAVVMNFLSVFYAYGAGRHTNTEKALGSAAFSLLQWMLLFLALAL